MKKLLLFGLLSIALGLSAQEHQPEVLYTVLDRVEESSAAGEKPVVIFDLDDTLLNARSRTRTILKDFVNAADIQTRFPKEAKKVAKLKLKETRYDLKDTLAGIQVTDEAFLKEASAFWLQKFFSNEYCADDLVISGAGAYVREIKRNGAHIVYLTGRDIPRMEICTLESLEKNGFPMGEHATLLMKPKKELDDLQFKKDAFVQIRKLGTVVAGFENEPANVNAFFEEWPEGQMVFLDTAHSSKPVVPHPSIPWVQNFMRD